jgi:hypothetical protein
MAPSKKGSRAVVFDHARYRWRAVNDAGSIALTIWAEDPPHRELTCAFTQEPAAGSRPAHKAAVTSRLVRRVLLHAVREHGYPKRSPPQLNLGSLDGVVALTDPDRSS